MNRGAPGARKSLLALLTALSVIVTSCHHTATAVPFGSVTVRKTDYHGWLDVDVLSNGIARVVIVPEIGRVMQFSFVDASRGLEEGPFWNNRELDGSAADANSRVWLNFGGDKSWPAPQSDWLRIERRSWPPPPAFDSTSMTSRESAAIDARSVTRRETSIDLSSTIDANYGIRILRRIQLDALRPMMTITTTYEKVQGKPVRVATWVLTQLNEPEEVFLALPSHTKSRAGFVQLLGSTPTSLKREGNLLSLERDPHAPIKIGTQAHMLVWVGKDTVLEIQLERSSSQRLTKPLSTKAEIEEFPDRGSRSEVYTNPDPLRYVELETLGPLQILQVGDRISQTNVYTLRHRTYAMPESEVQAIAR